MRIKQLDMSSSEKEVSSPAQYMLKLDEYQKKMFEFIINGVRRNEKQQSGQTESSLVERSGKPTEFDANPPQDNPNAVFEFGTKPDRIVTVEIYQGDLLKQNVDVIVNAANEQLILGGVLRSKFSFKKTVFYRFYIY